MMGLIPFFLRISVFPIHVWLKRQTRTVNLFKGRHHRRLDDLTYFKERGNTNIERPLAQDSGGTC